MWLHISSYGCIGFLQLCYIAIQGGTIGTSLLQGIYRAMMRNGRLSNEKSVCNHEKATPYLRIRDFSHRFPISNLTISRHVQFPNKESLISTFNFRRPAARKSRNSKFSEKLEKLENLEKFCSEPFRKSDENPAKNSSFSIFSSFSSFSENFEFPPASGPSRTAGGSR